MGKYVEDSKQLLEYVGGKENINAVSHCMTRLRFVLNDPKKADIKKIEAIPSVKGTFTQSGQFQVIIGNTVADFYNDFAAVSGVSGVSKAEVKQAAKKNQNVLQRIASVLAEIFAPLIPAIITGGLILGFRNVIDSMYVFEGGHTLVELSQTWAGIDHFLWLIGEAVFHIGIPVGICWSIMKKMGGTEVLGIILGITLTSSQLLNAYAVASTAAADIPVWDFGFAQVHMIGYQAQVIPAMLAGFVLAYLERLFRKIIPSVVSMIFVPFFSLLLAVMAAHFVLGPIGWKIGAAISAVVYAGITGPIKVLFAAVFGGLYAPLVITGLHHMTNAIDLQLANDFGGTMLWPMIALSNIAQGSAVLGMVVLQRRNAEKQEVNIPSMISCYMGVTEPAMFGVNLKYTFPFVSAMIGSCLAAIWSVFNGVESFNIGVGGLPGILSIKSQFYVVYLIAMAIAILVPMGLTIAIGKARGVDKESAPVEEDVVERTNSIELQAFLSGQTIDITEVPDQVFADKTLGDGVAIDPTDNVVVAPADGVITTTMPDSKHAVGMKLDNGAEILIHVGLDTVSMNGAGFEYHVEDGDRVKAGDKLITFSPKEITDAGHKTMTMLVVTDPAGAKVDFRTGRQVSIGGNIGVVTC
ncbi:MAG: PTS system trehalose-specific EIIBC component [Lachnospiraceae bacterium]|nr:PTS system trehalose-specific EIIBC component [Lachnospiraceae bacterium]